MAGVVGLAAALAATDADTTGHQSHGWPNCATDSPTGWSRRCPAWSETTVTDRDRGHLLPGMCHVLIDGVDSESLLFLLDDAGVRASAASSCASGAQQASHVLSAIGVATDAPRGALRLSLGWDSTDADVDLALQAVPAAVARIRERVPIDASGA